MSAVDLPGCSARGVLVVFMAFFVPGGPVRAAGRGGGGRGIGGSGGSGKPGESAFPPRAPRFAPRFSPGGAHRPENRSVRRAGTARFAAVPLSGTRGAAARPQRRRPAGVPPAGGRPQRVPGGGHPYFNFNGGAAAGEVLMELQSFFAQNPKVALGFSGGVDSSYLLCAGLRCGADVRAYYVKTPFQPQFELDDALRLAAGLGAAVTVLEPELLCRDQVASNPADRCYHCKKALFSALRERALRDGYPVLIDGTNASDDPGDRPGVRALRELEVHSPLRECGLGKQEIRRLSRREGLFTWDKPAYACLATRVPTGRRITPGLLARIEKAEDALFSLGFTDLRVRVYGDAARLQLPPGQLQRALECRGEITAALRPYFYPVLLDMEGRGTNG